jgi:hypothetical protein
MKGRSGLKDIYQNNPHPISDQTLRNFLHMAQVHLSDPQFSKYDRSTDNNDEIDDIETLGIEKLTSILNIEARKNLPSRFIWGAMSAKNKDSETLNLPDQEIPNGPDEITIP